MSAILMIQYLNFYREAHLNFFVWFRTSSIKYVILKSLYRISVSLLAPNQMVKNCFWAVQKYFRASINSNRLVCHCHGFIYRNMLYILFRRINRIRLSQLLYRYSTTSFVTDYKFWPILTTFDLKIMTSCSDTYYNSKVKWESNLSFD